MLEPENEYRRRGIEACARYVKETGAVQLRVPYDFVTPEHWSPRVSRRGAGQAVGSEAGTLAPSRRAALEEIDPGWSPALGHRLATQLPPHPDPRAGRWEPADSGR